MRRAIPLMLVLMNAALPVQAGESVSGDRGTDMMVDALIMRPLGLVEIALGTAITIVTLPFTLPGGNADEAAQSMIIEPLEYTFKRPLGEFD